jgi:hypothetical protein
MTLSSLSRPALLLLLLLASQPAVIACAAERDYRQITIVEARQLVLAYLRWTGATRLRGFALDEFESADEPEFYSFSAMFDNPLPGGSVVIGNYGVDKRTGDVWGTGCNEELAAPPLRALQRKIRARLGMTPSIHKKLKRTGHYC